MNWAHLHLMLNHVPVLGSVAVAALLAVATWKKSNDVARIGFWFAVFVGVLTFPAYFTGEPAEELIEHLPGVSERIIEAHENAALYALIATELMAGFALIGLVLSRTKRERVLTMGKLTFLLALVNLGLMAWIANLGGQIRHTEIRSDQVVQPSGESERDDD